MFKNLQLFFFAMIIFAGALYIFFHLFASSIKTYKKNSTAKKSKKILKASPYRKPPKGDEYLAKDKVLEKQKAEQRSKEGLILQNEQEITQEEVLIVDIAEPKGFWSRFIMGQKLGFIMARLNAQKKGGGFWTNLIKAQSASQGKDQSRGK